MPSTARGRRSLTSSLQSQHPASTRARCRRPFRSRTLSFGSQSRTASQVSPSLRPRRWGRENTGTLAVSERPRLHRTLRYVCSCCCPLQKYDEGCEGHRTFLFAPYCFCILQYVIFSGSSLSLPSPSLHALSHMFIFANTCSFVLFLRTRPCACFFPGLEHHSVGRDDVVFVDSSSSKAQEGVGGGGSDDPISARAQHQCVTCSVGALPTCSSTRKQGWQHGTVVQRVPKLSRVLADDCSTSSTTASISQVR